MMSELTCKLERGCQENTVSVMDRNKKKESNLVVKHLRAFSGPGSGDHPVLRVFKPAQRRTAMFL